MKTEENTQQQQNTQQLYLLAIIYDHDFWSYLPHSFYLVLSVVGYFLDYLSLSLSLVCLTLSPVCKVCSSFWIAITIAIA